MSKTFIDIIGKDKYDELGLSEKLRLNKAMRVAKSAIESKANELVIRTDGIDEKAVIRKFARNEVERFLYFIARMVGWSCYEVDDFTDKKKGNCVYLTRGLNNEDKEYLIDKFMNSSAVEGKSDMISDKEIMKKLDEYQWLRAYGDVRIYVGTKKVRPSGNTPKIADMLIDMISDYAIKGMSISSVGHNGYNTEIRFREKPKNGKWDEDTNCTPDLIEFIEAWKVLRGTLGSTEEERMEEYAKHSWTEVGKDVFRAYDKRNSYYAPKWAFIDK